MVAVPDEVQTNAVFDAVLTGCFPGETVTFVNFVPFQLEQAICDDITYTASVEFTASSTTGTRFIAATIPPLNSTDPDVPSLPPRAIFATYSVVTTIVIGPITGANDGISTSRVSPPSSGDWWPSFLSSSAILRTFLGLLALLAGIFFVRGVATAPRRGGADPAVSGPHHPTHGPAHSHTRLTRPVPLRRSSRPLAR